MEEVKYIYDGFGQIKNEYKDSGILDNFDEEIKILAKKASKMVAVEGYDRVQIENYLISRLSYEFICECNNARMHKK